MKPFVEAGKLAHEIVEAAHRRRRVRAAAKMSSAVAGRGPQEQREMREVAALEKVRMRSSMLVAIEEAVAVDMKRNRRAIER